MATYYHPRAKASWQGNYDTFSAGYSDVRLECIEIEVATSQLVLNDEHHFIKLDQNTVILGGWVEFDDLDSGTPAFEYDIGYIDDSSNDDPDAFLNSGVIANGGGVNVVLTTGIGTAVSTFLPADDYTVKGTVIAAPATAVAGTIKLCLLLANRESTNTAIS